MSIGHIADIIIIDGIKYIVFDVSKDTHPILCSDFTFNSVTPYDKNIHQAHIIVVVITCYIELLTENYLQLKRAIFIMNHFHPMKKG